MFSISHSQDSSQGLGFLTMFSNKVFSVAQVLGPTAPGPWAMALGSWA